MNDIFGPRYARVGCGGIIILIVLTAYLTRSCGFRSDDPASLNRPAPGTEVEVVTP